MHVLIKICGLCQRTARACGTHVPGICCPSLRCLCVVWVMECRWHTPFCVILMLDLPGVDAASCISTRRQCPELKRSPRILAAIKRRPAVSPSAYGMSMVFEKAVFWNTGNAMSTGAQAASPQLAAPLPSSPQSLSAAGYYSGASLATLGSWVWPVFRPVLLPYAWRCSCSCWGAPVPPCCIPGATQSHRGRR